MPIYSIYKANKKLLRKILKIKLNIIWMKLNKNSVKIKIHKYIMIRTNYYKFKILNIYIAPNI